MKKSLFISFCLVFLVLGMVRLEATYTPTGYWTFKYIDSYDYSIAWVENYRFNADGTVDFMGGSPSSDPLMGSGTWSVVDNNKFMMSSEYVVPAYSGTKVGNAMTGVRWSWGAGEWSMSPFYAVKTADL